MALEHVHKMEALLAVARNAVQEAQHLGIADSHHFLFRLPDGIYVATGSGVGTEMLDAPHFHDDDN